MGVHCGTTQKQLMMLVYLTTLNQYGTWDIRDNAIIFYSSGNHYVVFTAKDNNSIIAGDEVYPRASD